MGSEIWLSDIMRISPRTEDLDWITVRTYRNNELVLTDWWGVKDLTMIQAKKDYRTFLRDITDNYDTPNEAWDAWVAYPIEESWF
tara:strand:- start:224 stop:478 length:255 start_codon:yes stop_codon:yes gene_type:complete